MVNINLSAANFDWLVELCLVSATLSGQYNFVCLVELFLIHRTFSDKQNFVWLVN